MAAFIDNNTPFFFRWSDEQEPNYDSGSRDGSFLLKANRSTGDFSIKVYDEANATWVEIYDSAE